MSSYGFLAGCYDQLTYDVDYAAWADYIEKHFSKSALPIRTVLDLACGTGSLTRELALRGYEMIGADRSPEMLAQAAVWERRSVSLISDAYCVGQPIDVERAPVRLCTMAERSARRELGRKLCESGIPAKQVLDCGAAVSSLTAAPAEGGISYTAQVNASILYLSEDDALCSVEVDIPVTCRVDVPSGCECACRCRPVGECTAVPVTGGLEVRFEAEFTWNVTREEQSACVTGVKPGEVRDTGPRPSVVIRRVERGETLWDIAKSCGSTVDDIRCVNTLPGEEAAAGALLLIPARRN